MMMDRQRWEKEVGDGDGDGDTMKYELIEMTREGGFRVFRVSHRLASGFQGLPSGSSFRVFVHWNAAGRAGWR